MNPKDTKISHLGPSTESPEQPPAQTSLSKGTMELQAAPQGRMESEEEGEVVSGRSISPSKPQEAPQISGESSQAQATVQVQVQQEQVVQQQQQDQDQVMTEAEPLHKSSPKETSLEDGEIQDGEA